MATDYDAPRRTETDDVSEDSLEELKARRNEAASAVVDVDETESAESFELPVPTCPAKSCPSVWCPSRPTSSPVRAAFWCNTAVGWPARRTA